MEGPMEDEDDQPGDISLRCNYADNEQLRSVGHDI